MARRYLTAIESLITTTRFGVIIAIAFEVHLATGSRPWPILPRLLWMISGGSPHDLGPCRQTLARYSRRPWRSDDASVRVPNVVGESDAAHRRRSARSVGGAGAVDRYAAPCALHVL